MPSYRTGVGQGRARVCSFWNAKTGHRTLRVGADDDTFHKGPYPRRNHGTAGNANSGKFLHGTQKPPCKNFPGPLGHANENTVEHAVAPSWLEAGATHSDALDVGGGVGGVPSPLTSMHSSRQLGKGVSIGAKTCGCASTVTVSP